MNFLQKIEAWIVKEFTSFQADGAKVAVAVTEDLQTALKSGVVDDIASVISGAFPTVKNIPQEIVAGLKTLTPKLLAVELGIEGLPADPQEADIQAFAAKVAAAFNVSANNSKLYTTFGAQVYGILKADPKLTFISLADDVEQAFQDLQQDEADAQAAG